MRIGSAFSALPVATKNILIVNVIVWLALQIMPVTTVDKVLSFCALHYFTSQDFNAAQLVTYMFVHKDFLHLFFNMFALFMFGMIIERSLGTKRFLFYYFSCGIGAALIQLGVFAIMINHYASMLPDGITLKMIEDIPHGYMPGIADYYVTHTWSLINTPVIGASGAIYGILLAYGFMYPKMPVYLMFIPVPIQARWLVAGYAAIELLQGMSNNAGDNVAHFAHLGGMLVGFLILLYWKKKGLFNVNRF